MAENRRTTKYVLTAEDRTKQAFNSLKENLGAVDAKVIGLGAAFSGVFAGGAIAGGMAAVVKNAIDAMDSFDDLASKIGISVESLTSWSYSAQFADVSTEAVATAIKKLSTNMVEAQSGGDGFARIFKALNVEVEASAGVLRNADDVIFDLADRFAEMEDGAAKTALAVKLFGRSGIEMIPLLNQGAAGLRANAEEARKFGIVVSKDAAQAAASFNDNLIRLQSSAKGLGMALAQQMLPSLNTIIERLVEATKHGGSFLGTLGFMARVAVQGVDLGKLNRELAEINAQIAKTPEGSPRRRSLEEARTELQKHVEYAKFVQRQGANYLPDSERDERSRFGGGAPRRQAPVIPDEGAEGKAKAAREKSIRDAEALLDKYRDKLSGLQAEQRKALGIGDSEFAKMRHLLAEDKDMQKLDPAQRQRLTDASLELDLARETAEFYKELEAGVGRNQAERDAASVRERDALEALKKSYIDMADPIQKYRLQLEELAILRAKFPEHKAAWDEVEFKINIAIDETMGLNTVVKETNETARELGITFTSALESIIEKGGDAKDIIGSLLTDLAKVAMRRTVTEPILGGFEKILGPVIGGAQGWFDDILGSGPELLNTFFTPRARGGRVSPTGAYIVGEEGPEFFRPDSSGSIIPNGALGGGFNVAVYQSIHVDSRSDQNSIRRMIEASQAQTVAAVAQEVNRGGNYARMIRGK